MANLYWVGGTDNWDGTAGTKWALSSGGTGGEPVPTTADDVIFDQYGDTVTISTGNTGAKTVEVQSGFGAGTIAGTAALTVAGSFFFYSGGAVLSWTGTLTITGTGSIACLFFGPIFSNVIINGAGITVSLQYVTVDPTGTTTLTEGTLNLGGYTLNTGAFSSSGTLTRDITFGGDVIILTSTTAATTILSMADATNFTWTGSGLFIRDQAATATVAFGSTAGGLTTNAPNLQITTGGSDLTITPNSYFYDLNITGYYGTVTGGVNIANTFNLNFGLTYTGFTLTFLVSTFFNGGGLTFGGFGVNGAGINVTASFMTVDPTGTTTLTEGTLEISGSALSTGAFSSSGTLTRAINFNGYNIILTSTTAATTILSMADATGFTQANVFGSAAFIRDQAATATVAFGSTAGGSTANAPNLTVNTGTSALTITNSSYFNTLDIQNFFGTVTGGVNITNALYLDYFGSTYTGLTITFLVSTFFNGGGLTFGGFGVNGAGITVDLFGPLTLVGTLTLTEGALNLNNISISTGAFSSSNSNTRTLDMGSGTWTITGSGASAWNTATVTGLTLNPSTSTISMTSASAKTFAGGGSTYYNLNQGGAGALTISGSNTFNNIANTVQPNTVTFTAGTTQTVSTFGLSGTAGNLITINSSSAGTQATLSKASGTVNAQYLAIQDSNATGGATWNALFSTNLGNNTGWIFPGGNMFLMFS
jgi:hypothetical protein